jgi:gas vesicle protein
MKTEWALLLGVAIGAGLGLMFAPQSGKDTQEYIGRKAQDGFDQMVSAGKKVTAVAKDAASTAQNQFAQAVGAGKDQLAQAVEAGKDVYNEAGA